MGAAVPPRSPLFPFCPLILQQLLGDTTWHLGSRVCREVLGLAARLWCLCWCRYEVFAPAVIPGKGICGVLGDLLYSWLSVAAL